MLAVFFGTDRKGVRDAADAYATDSLEVTPNTIDENNYFQGVVTEAVGAASLFGEMEAYFIDVPSNDADLEAEVTGALADMAASTNSFIILENALLAPAKKKYQKHAAVCEEFAAEKAERFNTFALAEALAKKDKKTLWVLLQQAKLAGLREEEIIGMLWWQLKALRLAASTSTASEAGMKDFPYNKAKRALRSFGEGEIETLSQHLLELYHDGHAGKRELDIALETWVLKM